MNLLTELNIINRSTTLGHLNITRHNSICTGCLMKSTLQIKLRDYREKLTPGNRQLINQIFRFFTQADVDVCCGYAKHYLPTFKQPEVRMMLSAFAAMEAYTKKRIHYCSKLLVSVMMSTKNSWSIKQ